MPWKTPWFATARPTSSTPTKVATFTSEAFTGILSARDIQISMDGKGRCRDYDFVERLWRSLKYEEIFITAYATAAEARSGIGAYLTHDNDTRPHPVLGYRTPREVFEAGAGLRICGRSALPTGCAFPHGPDKHCAHEECRARDHGDMLTFTHRPTSIYNNDSTMQEKVPTRSPDPAK